MKNDFFNYIILNHEFHLTIVKMSESQSIVEIYSRLGWPLLKTQYLSFTQGENIKKSIIEHEKIFDYIVNGDKKTLTDLMTTHNDYVISSVRALIEKDDL